MKKLSRAECFRVLEIDGEIAFLFKRHWHFENEIKALKEEKIQILKQARDEHISN